MRANPRPTAGHRAPTLIPTPTPTPILPLIPTLGVVYYAVVDGYNGDEGGYDLTARLYPNGDAERCAGSPLSFNGDPPSASVVDTTATFLPDEDGCSDTGNVSHSAVYRFQAPRSGFVTVTLNPGSGVDALLYVGLTCGVGDQGCADLGGSGANEQAVFQTTADTTYYVVVDGYNASSGDFELILAY